MFPEEYASRAKETTEEEEENNVASPDLSSLLAVKPPASSPGHISREDFLCDVCGELLHAPCILDCGHAVCSIGCLDAGTEKYSSTLGSAYECACGACGQPTPRRPKICQQLVHLLQTAFPEKYKAREVHVLNEAEARKKEVKEKELQKVLAQADTNDAADAAATNSGEKPQGVRKQGQQPYSQEGAGTTGGVTNNPRSSNELATSAEGVTLPSTSAAASTAPGASTAPEGPPEGLSGPHATIWKWLHGEEYIHHGIGCDICGQYPIIGRRFRCTECPEAVGFDLCGPCYDRGAVAAVGRFNQRHTAEHKMELCRPRLTSLHMLRAANPDLPFEQLMYLLELSAMREEERPGGAGEGDAAEAAVAPLPATEGREQQGEEAVAVAVAAGQGAGTAPQGTAEQGVLDEGVNAPELAMPRGRGPRPVIEPTAEWPSPSAPPSPPQE